MIDFDKLNSMIDEVNTVINDVNKETKCNRNELNNLKEVAYNNAVADLIKYCNILTKAIKGFEENIEIEIPIDGHGDRLMFTRHIPYEATPGTYAVEVTNGDYQFYRIINNNGWKESRAKEYGDINHSHKSVIWFENLAADWDNVKDKIEEGIVNGVNYILKEKAEFAHKENVKAKKNLESFLNF